MTEFTPKRTLRSSRSTDAKTSETPNQCVIALIYPRIISRLIIARTRFTYLTRERSYVIRPRARA